MGENVYQFFVLDLRSDLWYSLDGVSSSVWEIKGPVK